MGSGGVWIALCGAIWSYGVRSMEHSRGTPGRILEPGVIPEFSPGRGPEQLPEPLPGAPSGPFPIAADARMRPGMPPGGDSENWANNYSASESDNCSWPVNALGAGPGLFRELAMGRLWGSPGNSSRPENAAGMRPEVIPRIGSEAHPGMAPGSMMCWGAPPGVIPGVAPRVLPELIPGMAPGFGVRPGTPTGIVPGVAQGLAPRATARIIPRSGARSGMRPGALLGLAPRILLGAIPLEEQ